MVGLSGTAPEDPLDLSCTSYRTKKLVCVLIYRNVYIYIYIYIYLCVCVCLGFGV